MKRFVKIMSLALCAAALLSLPALAAEDDLLISPAPSVESLAPVRVWGRVTRLESGSLLLKNDSKDAIYNEVVVHLPEGVPCVDAVTGLPMDMSKVKDGDTLYAWVGNAMTMSLPPQTSALIVVGNIPADYRVPEFYKITGLDRTVMAAIYPAPERTEVNLPVAGGETLTIPVSARFTPWLTRQIVTVDDLVPGSQILVWKDKDGKVEKVLLLPYAYRGYVNRVTAPNMDVLLCVNGKFDGNTPQHLCKKTDEAVLAPLRSVAEAAGYEVSWVSGQGAVVKDGDKVLFSVLPGSETVKRPGNKDGDWELTTPCVMEKGVTYLPEGELAMLLNLYLCQG